MIPRYSTPEMDAVWSDVRRFGRWLEVELLATEGHAKLDVVPAADAAVCRDRAPVVDEAFVEAVLDTGYTGAFELELVGPAIEAEGHAGALRRSVERTDALLREVLP